MSGDGQTDLTELWQQRWPRCPPVGYKLREPYRDEDDPDPEFRAYCHLFADRRAWQPGCIDDLLRDTADDKVAGILITDTRMQRVPHPYDGGADVFLTTSDERDRMRQRHADWLSSHPSGL